MPIQFISANLINANHLPILLVGGNSLEKLTVKGFQYCPKHFDLQNYFHDSPDDFVKLYSDDD